VENSAADEGRVADSAVYEGTATDKTTAAGKRTCQTVERASSLTKFCGHSGTARSKRACRTVFLNRGEIAPWTEMEVYQGRNGELELTQISVILIYLSLKNTKKE
jgi:hypothetical protein